MIHKIQLGYHKLTNRLLSVMSAERGKKCNCICPKCEEPLIAAQGVLRQYFKHENDTSNCNDSTESLGHWLSKEILSESCEVSVTDGQIFHYDNCKIEQPIYGKRPDGYLINTRSNKTLIVEIFHSNRKKQSDLLQYWDYNEAILGINIKDFVFDESFSYESFKKYVLHSGPRRLHACPIVSDAEPVQNPTYHIPIYGANEQKLVSFILFFLMFLLGLNFVKYLFSDVKLKRGY